LEIAGKTVLVTGANRGLGAAIVKAFVEAGAARVYAGMRTVERVAAGSKVVPVALDVTNDEQIAAAARLAGDVDIVVNNAGYFAGQPLVGTSDARGAEAEMRVNYFGPLAVSRAFAPILVRNGGGAIINVLSILSRVSGPSVGSYAASKAAAYSLTQAMRGELRANGTRVLGLMPGFIDTDMAASVKAPKLAPSAVADAMIAALRDGTDDIYPGDAATVAAGLLTNPQAIEQHFATLFATRSATSTTRSA